MDRALQFFLYFVILSNALLALIWMFVWALERIRRRSSPRPKLFWRDLLNILAGLVGWYLLSVGIANWIVFFTTCLLILLGTVATEFADRALAKHRGNSRAT
jgi:hypothetical protein